MPADSRSFGALLKRYRLAAGLTHEELAERAGIGVRTISDLERGISRRPRRDTLGMLLGALDLPPSQRATLSQAARPDLGTSLRPALARSSLPTTFTSFVGREQELQTLHALVTRPDTRLVTVTGPGGVGKTRLSIEVASNLIDAFEGGVVYVGLAPVLERDGIIRAVLGALNIPVPSGSSAFSALVAALEAHRVLLLLDNWEHLLEASPLVTDLLRACPRLTVLATSRAPLRLSGEHELLLHPLVVLDPRHMPALDVVAMNPAVELFIDRVTRIHQAFTLAERNAIDIVAICERLDGLPLAIELAAARIKLLTPSALLARLTDDTPGAPLKLLTGGARDWPERHHMLRSTVAWSYRLLSSDEQRLFRQLSVFAGGCTLEAAEAVCDASATGSGERSALECLAALVDNSLLQRVDGPDGTTRVAMLETVRQYAAEELVAHGEEDAARRRHAMYYLAQVESTGGLLFAGSTQRIRGAIEHHNIHAALTWLVQQG